MTEPDSLHWRGVVHYPDPDVIVLDPRFARYRIGSAVIERIATGCRWAEGPVWFGDQRMLVWSDIPNDRMLRWDEQTGRVSPFRAPAHFTNGNTRDRQGRLISCEHQSRRVTRTEYDGTITVLADSFAGKRLNAPNDVVVHSSGAIYFTDPGYGILSDYEGDTADFELSRNVYRIDPVSGRIQLVVDDMDRPNGLCFSPDERQLYIVDTGASHTPDGPAHVRVFAVGDDGLPRDGRVFVDMRPGMADGIRTDRDGNLWIAAGWGGYGFDGVHCVAPDGSRIGQIRLPEACANLCFGGRRRNRLFMTASQSVYALYLDTCGAPHP